MGSAWWCLHHWCTPNGDVMHGPLCTTQQMAIWVVDGGTPSHPNGLFASEWWDMVKWDVAMEDKWDEGMGSRWGCIAPCSTYLPPMHTNAGRWWYTITLHGHAWTYQMAIWIVHGACTITSKEAIWVQGKGNGPCKCMPMKTKIAQRAIWDDIGCILHG